MPGLWLTCDHFVGEVSAMGQPTRPAQPSIPSGSVNKSVVIDVSTLIAGRRLLNDRPGLRMAAWSQVKSPGLSLWPMGYTPALSVTQKRRCSCSCRLWCYKCYALFCLLPSMA